MKIKIEYEYDATLAAPYVAKAKINDIYTYSCSVDNFLDAKNKLINNLKLNKHPRLPEPEEVEI